jgi:hypothetical protein
MPRISDADICNLALDQIGQTNISSLTDGSLAASKCARNFNQMVRNVLNSGRWKSARHKIQLAQRQGLVDPATIPAFPGPDNPNYPYPYQFVGGWPPGNTNYTISDDGPGGGNVSAGMYGSPQMPYPFQLPVDYIRLVRFNDVDSTVTSYPFWEVRGDVIWTNQTKAFLEYVRDVTIPATGATNPPGLGVLDPALVEVIIKGLAARLAWVFQQSQKLQTQLVQEYDLMLRRALAIDSRSEKVALRSPYIDSSWIRARWTSTFN